MSSTRRVCASAGLLSVLALAACLPAARVVVEPVLAQEANVENLGGIKVVVRNALEDAPEIFGPIPLDGRARIFAASVPPNTPFYVDVWGCESGVSCDPGDGLVARGCTTGLQELEAGKVGVLNLQLFSPDQPEFAVCPPELPDL